MQTVGELCCNKFKIDVASELEQYKTGACRLIENAAVFLDKMSGFDFEELVTDILKRLGYGHIEKILFTKDGGRDILIHSPNGLIVIECKGFAVPKDCNQLEWYRESLKKENPRLMLIAF